MPINVYSTIPGFSSALLSRLSNARKSGLWKEMLQYMQSVIRSIFRLRGGIFGVKRWNPIKDTMYGKKRVGSDGLRTYGRYSPTSQPLNVSGNYRTSHRKLTETPIKMMFGSDFDPDFARWIINAGEGPRQTMPDTKNNEFNSGVNRITGSYLERVVKESHREARLRKVN